MARRTDEGREEGVQAPAWLQDARREKLPDRPHRTGVNLSADALKRLRHVKAHECLDFSVVVDALIRTYVQGYRLSWTPTKEQAEEAA